MTHSRRPPLTPLPVLWTISLLVAGAARLDAQDVELTDPLSMISQDWQLTLGVDERIVLDVMKYGSRNHNPNGLEVDSLYLTFDLAYEDSTDEAERPQLRARVEPDLIGVDTRRHLYEAWLGMAFPGNLELRAGQVKVPLGSEGASWIVDAVPYEYSFPASLDTRYDLGLALRGAPWEPLWLESTATFGDGFDLEGESRREPQYSVRAVLRPFPNPGTFLGGLHLGGALAFQPRTDSTVHLVTPAENVVFRTPRLRGSSGLYRHLEAQWAFRQYRAGVEWALGEIRNVRAGGMRNDFDQLTAWSAHVSIHLTGEDHTWAEGAWQPLAPTHTINQGGKGSLALNARYSNADIDRALFTTGLTSYDPSTQEVRTFTASLAWYPLQRNRLEIGWIRTLADDELTTFGGSNRDSTWFARFVVGF